MKKNYNVLRAFSLMIVALFIGSIAMAQQKPINKRNHIGDPSKLNEKKIVKSRINAATSKPFSIGNASKVAVYQQGFNGGSMPSDWTSTIVTDAGGGTPLITFETVVEIATTFPCAGVGPSEGSHMARFNSWDAEAGDQIRLAQTTPFATTGLGAIAVNYDWLKDNIQNGTDNVQVQYSLDGTTWINVGSPVNNHDGSLPASEYDAPDAASMAWTQQSVVLPPAANDQAAVYVAFLFTSAYLNNCHLDNLTITATSLTDPPAFAITPSSPFEFPTIFVGGDSYTQTFTISNVGGGTLSIDPITISGDPSLTIVGANTAVEDILPGGSFSFDVVFLPTVAGVVTADITITDNIPDKVTNTLTINAEGLAPYAIPYHWDFEDSDANWLYVDNDGDGSNWYDANYLGVNDLVHSGDWAVGSFVYNSPGSDNYLISPKFSITGTDPKLSFSVAPFYAASFTEDYQVLVSTTTKEIASFTQELSTANLTVDGFQFVELDLTPYIGQDIYIAFRHYSAAGAIMFIDDVNLTNSTEQPISFDVEDAGNFAPMFDAVVTFNGWTPYYSYPYTFYAPDLATDLPYTVEALNFATVDSTILAVAGAPIVELVNMYGHYVETFSFAAVNPPSIGSIDQKNHIITCYIPAGLDRSNLVPTILTAGGATVLPVSDVAYDFATNPFITVTGYTGISQVYNINFVEVLAGWYFPNNPDDAIVDIASTANAAKTLTLVGAAENTPSPWAGGYTNPLWAGVTAYNSKSWNGGNGTKYWLVDISTENYKNIKFTSKHVSSSTGPRDLKVQYSIDGTTWNDITGSDILIKSGYWTFLPANAADGATISLPTECDNLSSLKLRWIMSSAFNLSGGAVAATGQNRIEDLFIYGEFDPTASVKNIPTNSFGVSVYPNPTKDVLNVISSENIISVKISDILAKTSRNYNVNGNNTTINTSDLNSGLYILQIETKSGISTQKVQIVK